MHDNRLMRIASLRLLNKIKIAEATRLLHNIDFVFLTFDHCVHLQHIKTTAVKLEMKKYELRSGDAFSNNVQSNLNRGKTVWIHDF